MKLSFEKVIESSLNNVYELHVTFMHGDDDHKSITRMQFYDQNELIEKGIIIKDRLQYSRDNWNDFCNTNQEWCNDQVGWLEADFDYASDHEFYALPDSYKMFYWDEYGDKYRVKFDEQGGSDNG